MKIKLSRENDLNIIAISGSVTPHEAKVLRAGILKLVKDGKDKIILHLLEKQEFEADVVSELRDLASVVVADGGALVLAGASVALREKIRGHDRSGIPCFDSIEFGVKYFSEHIGERVDVPELEPIDDLESLDADGLGTKLQILEDQNRALTELFKHRNIDEIVKLRAKKATIDLQLAAMVDLHAYMKKFRRDEFQDDTWTQRYTDTRGMLTEFVKTAKAIT